jgi:hypothetical protein
MKRSNQQIAAQPAAKSLSAEHTQFFQDRFAVLVPPPAHGSKEEEDEATWLCLPVESCRIPGMREARAEEIAECDQREKERRDAAEPLFAKLVAT